MSCLTCFQSKPIPRCLQTIVIGQGANNLNVIVQIKYFNGRIEQIPTTSSNAGLITLDVSEIEFMVGVIEIRIYDENYENQLDVNVQGKITDCIEVMIEDGEADNAIITEKE